MRIFVTFIISTLYLFSYSYQSEPYYQTENEEIATQDIDSSSIELEFVESQSESSFIHYTDLKTAKREALNEQKLVLVKIESTNCPSCMELNALLDTNENIKSMVNTYTKAVKYNREYDNIPTNFEYIGTPTLFLFDSNGDKMLMKLEGSDAIEELEESLETVIYNKS